jgi:hypothetical protein
MGEAKTAGNFSQTEVAAGVAEGLRSIETAGGRYQVRWNEQAAVTPLGQMAFFIEFLQLTGVFDAWVADCPLDYTSPNAPRRLDLLGTWMLSVLSGHKRYAHVTSIRSDGVNPDLLGMTKVVSEDALRRGLEKIPADQGVSWLQSHLERSVLPLLKAPWIMDIDTTIKVIYGKQEGAEVGYNPKKPGRPCHVYHSYLVAGLRLVLDAEVHPGTKGHSNHTLPGLKRILDQLMPEQRPYLVRGDCAYGNEPFISALEARGQDYLFKLKQSAGVKRFIERVFSGSYWSNAFAGWEATSGEIRLAGWDRHRRVIVLRRRIRNDVVVVRQDATGQQIIEFPEDEDISMQAYEYAVLVTSLPHDAVTISQLYRDRADAENTFDELKNQWGWGGFTTQDLHRCQLTARTVALVYNWWSLYARLIQPGKRMEAITSRPLLLSGIAEQTRHSRQKRITITPVHGRSAAMKDRLVKVSERLQEWKRTAEQLEAISVWSCVCDYLITILAHLDLSRKQVDPPPPPLFATI